MVRKHGRVTYRSFKHEKHESPRRVIEIGGSPRLGHGFSRTTDKRERLEQVFWNVLKPVVIDPEIRFALEDLMDERVSGVLESAASENVDLDELTWKIRSDIIFDVEDMYREKIRELVNVLLDPSISDQELPGIATVNFLLGKLLNSRVALRDLTISLGFSPSERRTLEDPARDFDYKVALLRWLIEEKLS